MPTQEELQSYIIERLQAYDPSMDISEGSPIWGYVVTPLITKLGTDPLETDIGDFIRARLREAHPTLDVREEDVLTDVLVSPLTTLLEPFKREINAIRISQSISDPSLLGEAELDAHLANLFFSRSAGQKAQGVVRLYFSAPATVTATPLTKFSTVSGLYYYPTTTQAISAAAMLLNQEGTLYYFDVNIQAEQEGIEYNVAAGEITRVDGIYTTKYVTNPAAMSTLGVAKETNIDYMNRAETALSERSLNTSRGLTARLMELYPTIRALQPIGYRDPEMERDILTGTYELSAGSLGLATAVQLGATGTLAAHTLVVGAYTLGTADGKLRTLADTFLVIPTEGSVITIYHAGLTPTISQHVVDGSPTAPNPTGALVYFTDYTWVGDQPSYLTGVDGATTELDVSSNTPQAGTDGADLPFTNIMSTAAGDFLPSGSPVMSGDTIFFESASIAQSGASNVSSVLTSSRIQSDSPIIIYQVGNDATARPGYIPAGGGFDVGVANAVDLDNPAVQAGYIMILRADPGPGTAFYQNAAGPPSEDWFTVVSYDNTADSLVAGFKKITLAESVINPGALISNVAWSIVSADLTPLPNVANAPLWHAPETNIAWAFRRTATGVTLMDPAGPGAVIYVEQPYMSVTTVNNTSQLTISGIPGGIAFPNTANGNIDIDNDEVHIGGMTDAHIRATDITEGTVAVTLEDDNPIYMGTNGIATIATSTFYSPTVSTWINLAQVGDLLVLKDGDIGSYYIAKITGAFLTVINLSDPDSAAFTLGGAGLRYEIVRSITVDIVEPKETKVPDTFSSPRTNPVDMITNLGLSTVTTASTKDFLASGVVAGDILEIHSGLDEGVYTILGVSGAGNDTLNLDSMLNGGQTGIEYSIYTLSENGGITLPMLRIKKIELLGSNGEPTNVVIPYADPVDIRSSDFGNRGDGIKMPNETMSGNDIITNAGNAIITIAANSTGNFYTAGIAAGDIISWSDGPNASLSRMVLTVDSATQITLTTMVTYTDHGLGTSVQPDMGSYTLGAPSIGTARCYFLDPTTFEVNSGTTFTTESGLPYTPDPSNNDLYYDPDLPGSATATHLGNTITWLDTGSYKNPLQLGIEIGDIVWLGYRRLQGAVLTGGVNVNGLTFIVTEHGVGTHTVTFIGTNPILPSSSLGYGGVLEQLQVGLPGTFKVESIAVDTMAISCTNRITIGAGTANALLGFSSGTTNYHNGGTNKGTGYYLVSVIDDSGPAVGVTVTNLDGTAATFGNVLTYDTFQLKFYHPATQRITSTDMVENTEYGLYYFDVQLISSAPGNQYNISDDTRMLIDGHISDGYLLSPTHDVHTFSTAEELDLVVYPTILRSGEDDKLINKMLLPGQQVQITYEHIPTVSSCQDTMLSDSERVINDNPLARTYFPSYVRMSMRYTAGSLASVVKGDIVQHINSLQADTDLEAFDVQNLAKNRGATYVQEPTTLIAITHQKDRTIRGYKSQDKIELERNERFIADEDFIEVTRS